MNLLFALLLIIVLLVFWLLTLFNLPGNWLMVIAAAVYAYCIPADSWASIGGRTVIVLLVLATLGEILELLAGAAGTAQAGGSRRGVVFALIGSILGGIFGALIGLPIPLFGSLFAALLFAAIGAMLGAMLGEISAGRSFIASWRIGKAAFQGRLAGTLAKMLIGALMVVSVIGSLIL